MKLTVDTTCELVVQNLCGINYVLVTLEGKVTTFDQMDRRKCTLHYRKNIFHQNVNTAQDNIYHFPIEVGNKSTLEHTPKYQEMFNQTMFMYQKYMNGEPCDDNYEFTQCEQDAAYDLFVSQHEQCPHEKILPTYSCPYSGSRIEYELVAYGYTNNSVITLKKPYIVEIDYPYTSANIHAGTDAYHFYGLTDTIGDRLCAANNLVTVPVPQPLKINTVNEIAVYTPLNFQLSLVCVETKKLSCNTTEEETREILSLQLNHTRTPTGCTFMLPSVYPSFEGCRLRISYFLLLTIDKHTIKVPVGVNICGQEE